MVSTVIINFVNKLHTCPFIKTFFFFSFMLRGEGSNRFMCPPSTGVRSRGLYPRPNWSCFGLGRYSVSTSSGAYVTPESQSTSSSPSSSLSPSPTSVKQKYIFFSRYVTSFLLKVYFSIMYSLKGPTLVRYSF